MDLPSPQPPLSLRAKVEQERSLAIAERQLREVHAELSAVIEERDREIFDLRLKVAEVSEKPSKKQDRLAMSAIAFIVSAFVLLAGSGRIKVQTDAIAVESREVPESVMVAAFALLAGVLGYGAVK